MDVNQEVIDILRDLVKDEGIDESSWCHFCQERLDYDLTPPAAHHTEWCIMRRAKAVVEQTDLALVRLRIMEAFDLPAEFLKIIEETIELRKIMGTEEEQQRIALVRNWREWVRAEIRKVGLAPDQIDETADRNTELMQAQRYFTNVQGRVQVASHPESYKGAYVRTESLSRWPGCGRKKADSPEPCQGCDCKPEVPYGGEGWVVQDEMFDGQRMLVMDWGYAFPIDPDTVVTFPTPQGKMLDPEEGG